MNNRKNNSHLRAPIRVMLFMFLPLITTWFFDRFRKKGKKEERSVKPVRMVRELQEENH